MDKKMTEWLLNQIEYHQSKETKAKNSGNYNEALVHQSKAAAHEEFLMSFNK